MRVDYINHMGSDDMVVDAARVSFEKLASNFSKEQNAKLIHYLAKHNHWSPFSHPQIQLRVTVPIFVANQLKRHQVGFALNEVSRRYVDDEPEFYYPKEWRGRPPGSIKQGSSDAVIKKFPSYAWAAGIESEDPCMIYEVLCQEAINVYNRFIAEGIAPEMARMVLPQSMYTSWIWTASVAAYARLCKQRLDPHAQQECREVAQQIADILEPMFPVSWAALMDDKTGARP